MQKYYWHESSIDFLIELINLKIPLIIKVFSGDYIVFEDKKGH